MMEALHYINGLGCAGGCRTAMSKYKNALKSVPGPRYHMTCVILPKTLVDKSSIRVLVEVCPADMVCVYVCVCVCVFWFPISSLSHRIFFGNLHFPVSCFLHVLRSKRGIYSRLRMFRICFFHKTLLHNPNKIPRTFSKRFAQFAKLHASRKSTGKDAIELSMRHCIFITPPENINRETEDCVFMLGFGS